MTATTRKNRGALKGAIAAGAATAVLMGGFGAFSLWSDSKTEDLGSLTTGVLEVNGVTNGSWHLDSAAGSVIDLANFAASPNDVLVYTADVTGKAVGDDMWYEVTVNDAAFDEDAVAAGFKPGEVTIASTGTGAGSATRAATKAAVTADPTAANFTKAVTVTVTLDADQMTAKELQGLTGALEDLSFTAEQVADA